MTKDKNPYEVLRDAIGENAARAAIDALCAHAKVIREGRKGARAMIVFDHPNAAEPVNWGKLVTQYTRTIDTEN